MVKMYEISATVVIFSGEEEEKYQSSILMKFGINVIFEKKYLTRIFSLSAIVDVEGVEITLKVGGPKQILPSTSKITEDTVLL